MREKVDQIQNDISKLEQTDNKTYPSPIERNFTIGSLVKPVVKVAKSLQEVVGGKDK